MIPQEHSKPFSPNTGSAQEPVTFCCFASMIHFVSGYVNRSKYLYIVFSYQLLFSLISIDCCKYSILFSCPFWKLASGIVVFSFRLFMILLFNLIFNFFFSETSLWRVESDWIAAHQRQILELCFLQVYLYIWYKSKKKLSRFMSMFF